MKTTLLTILLVGALILSACSTNSTSLQEETQDVINAEDNYEEEVEDVMEELDKIAPQEDMATSYEGYGLSYEVDGVMYAFEEAQVLAQTPVADYLTIIAPDATKIQLRTLPNEKGTFEIGKGPAYREVNVWFPHEGKRYDADAQKGSGKITFTSIGTMHASGYTGDIKGTFSGTFVASDGSEIVVKKGTFFAEGIEW